MLLRNKGGSVAGKKARAKCSRKKQRRRKFFLRRKKGGS